MGPLMVVSNVLVVSAMLLGMIASVVFKRWGRAHHKWPTVQPFTKDGARIFLGLKPSFAAKKGDGGEKTGHRRQRSKVRVVPSDAVGDTTPPPQPTVVHVNPLDDQPSPSSGGAPAGAPQSKYEAQPGDGSAGGAASATPHASATLGLASPPTGADTSGAVNHAGDEGAGSESVPLAALQFPDTGGRRAGATLAPLASQQRLGSAAPVSHRE